QNVTHVSAFFGTFSISLDIYQQVTNVSLPFPATKTGTSFKQQKNTFQTAGDVSPDHCSHVR
ncbi:MAG: hypothetical protein ACTIN8_04725, partial [Pseudolactococcus laudensis]